MNAVPAKCFHLMFSFSRYCDTKEDGFTLKVYYKECIDDYLYL